MAQASDSQSSGNLVSEARLALAAPTIRAHLKIGDFCCLRPLAPRLCFIAETVMHQEAWGNVGRENNPNHCQGWCQKHQKLRPQLLHEALRYPDGLMLGLYWDNGKENGNYYLGLRGIVPLSLNASAWKLPGVVNLDSTHTLSTPMFKVWLLKKSRLTCKTPLK